MGNPKQKWTSEEEEALRAGVAKHGAGKWKNIQRDPEFNHLLYSRSNIDLKDKWRNLNVNANGQGSREKSRAQKAKANADAPTTPLSTPKGPASATPLLHEASNDAVFDDSSKCALDGRNAAGYNTLIFEALSTLKEPNGSDISEIVSFIEKKQAVPADFRKSLSNRLRKLVTQKKLEKIQNCYRIKRDALPVTKQKEISPRQPPPPKQKEISPRQPQHSGYLGDTVEEVAVTAAYKIAEAENKSFVAAEAVKEAERVSKLAEDAESLFQLAKEIFDKCSQGEIVLMP